MNWLTNIIRPRIRSLVGAKEVPDNLWQKCPGCENLLFTRDLEARFNVCNHCGHHLRLPVKQRLNMLFDDGKHEMIDLPKVAVDPLKFRDSKKYADRLRDTQAKTGLKDAITVAAGTVGGQKIVIAVFNFNFMGGSMGMAVGEGIVRAAEEAVTRRAALMIIPSSGGARMQEGILSLMQMPRTMIAVERVKRARLPYIVLLTNPTTGGVSASFAMVGDIHMAEPGATIGFAGRRVIEETVRETLPKDFQTAEYLREHGMVDMVVPRSEMREILARILRLLMDRGASQGDVMGGDGKAKAAGSGKSLSLNTPANNSSQGQLAAKRALRQVRAAKRALENLETPDSGRARVGH